MTGRTKKKKKEQKKIANDLFTTTIYGRLLFYGRISAFTISQISHFSALSATLKIN
jgi:hypothetical protein